MARGFIGLGLAAALGASIAGLAPAALAQDKEVQLKLAHWVPPAHPLQPALQAWAADIEKASNGSIKSTIFPAEQLGKAFDHYDMARDGIADFAWVNPGYQPGRFPIIAAGELPFLIADAKGGSAALDTWYRKYAATEMKDVHFCLAFVNDPGTFHSHKKIVLPSDLKGLKVRPADAITFPWGSIVLFGIDKVVKYHIDSAFYVTEQTWVLNPATYAKLSPAQKKVMDEHCSSDWALKIATPWADFESGGNAKIKALPGHEVYPLTPDQLAAWKKSAEPIVANWEADVKKAGQDPKAVLDELKATVKKYNSAY